MVLDPFLGAEPKAPAPLTYLQINAKVLHFLSKVHTSPVEPRLNERSDGLAQAAETFRLAGVCTLLLGAVPPPAWGLFVSVGSGRSMGDTGPNIRCSQSLDLGRRIFESPGPPSTEGVLRL